MVLITIVARVYKPTYNHQTHHRTPPFFTHSTGPLPRGAQEVQERAGPATRHLFLGLQGRTLGRNSFAASPRKMTASFSHVTAIFLGKFHHDLTRRPKPIDDGF